MRRIPEHGLHARGIHYPGRGAVVHGEPFRYEDAEAFQEGPEIIGPAYRHGDIAHGVFDNQVPADYPGDNLAQGGIGIGVSRTGDRDNRGEFSVADRGESADYRCDYEGEHDCRAGPRPEDIAGRGRADCGENPRADYRPDAEHGELHRSQRALEPIFGAIRIL